MKQVTKKSISLFLSVLMVLSLFVNALAVDDIKVNATLDKSEIASSAETQEVKVRVRAAQTVSICNYGMKLIVPSEDWVVTAIENDDANAPLTKADYNLKAGTISWQSEDTEDYDITNFAIYTLQVPVNVAAGTYELKITNVDAAKGYGKTKVLTTASNTSVTLTVKDNTPAAEGYTVAVSGNTTIQTGDKAMVKLDITNPKVDHYNAVDMKLTYDANVLSFDKDSCINLPAEATVTDTNGSLRIQFYGADRTAEIQLAFTGKAGGTGEVKVTEAKVDEAANANMQNAPAATVTGSAAITVGQTYNVNRDTNVVDGNSKAEAGKDYTFKLANGLDGKYMDVKYTVGGVEKTLTANADGSYTIPKEDVTGDITITAVGKTYTVTKDGTGKDNVTLTGNTATYGTNYTFTLNKVDNYAYTVTVTAGDKTVTPTLNADGKTYTINGKDITGDVVIAVIKEANKAQINFAGSGVADVVNGSTSQTVEPGQDFKFSIDKKDGYEYIVTAEKADGTAVTVTDNGDGTYTIAGADIKAGDVITVTVEKKLIETKYTIEVNEFVKIGANAEGKAQSVFLITAKLNEGVALAEGKVLAYGNNPMFQNAERYDGAYAYLVISDKTLDEVKAEAEKAGQITEVTGTAQTFNVNGDVNGTGLVDINDAQLVYNIYNTKYDSFDTTTMAMFLAADMNGSKTVDVKDAAAVVAKIQ